MTEHEPNPRAVAGNNSENSPEIELTLAGDTKEEKLKSAGYRLKKLLNDRRYIATSLTDFLKVEKERGRDVKAIRVAIRLDRMTPEKRTAWKEAHAKAAALFGIVIEFSDEDPPERDEQWAALETAKLVDQQIREVDEEKKLLKAACVVAEINYEALMQVVRSQIRDEEHEDASEFHDTVDSYGVILGVW